MSERTSISTIDIYKAELSLQIDAAKEAVKGSAKNLVKAFKNPAQFALDTMAGFVRATAPVTVPSALALGGVAIYEAANPVIASAECNAQNPDCQNGKLNPERCDLQDREAYLEFMSAQYADKNGDRKLTNISEIVAASPNRVLTINLYNQVIDKKQVNPEVATDWNNVDTSKPALTIKMFVKADGTGWAVPLKADNSEYKVGEKLEGTNYEYVTNPETGNPAIKYSQTDLGEIYGKGIDKATGVEKIIPKVYGSVAVLDSDGSIRKDSQNRFWKWNFEAGLCVPCYGPDTNQNVSYQDDEEYKKLKRERNKENDTVYGTQKNPKPESIK